MKFRPIVVPIAAAISFAGCQNLPLNSRSDHSVTATSFGTQTSYKDIADGVVWQHPDNGAHYFIATAEGDGVIVFDEKGKEIAQVNAEALAADIAYGVAGHDLLTFAQEDDVSLAFYTFNPSTDGLLSAAGKIRLGMKPSHVCLYKNPTTQATTVTAISESGDVVQYKLTMVSGEVQSAVKDDAGNALPVREFNVGGELSACVIDSSTATLYIAEQNVGVWAYGADVENVKDRWLVDAVEPLGHLIEIEGMDIALQEDGGRILWVADEGAGLVAYKISDENTYLGAIDIEGFDEIKRVSVASNGLWLGNTELEAPVYEWLPTTNLNQAFGITSDMDASMPLRDLTVSGVNLVPATGETNEVDDDGDAADDSAFWLNPTSPEESLIIATNKQGGLMAYNLAGDELQYLEGGTPNNVDIRTVQTEQGPRVIAAATNRDLNTIAFYEIQHTDSADPITPLGVVGDFVSDEAAEAQTELNEIYGFCLGQVDGNLYAYANGKSGVLEQWEVKLIGEAIQTKPVRTLSVPTQPEGCVVDDKTATLYLGEEDQGIWKFDARPNGTAQGDMVVVVDGQTLVDDVEGLTLVNDANQHWLVASSQGNNTYSVYDIAQSYAFVGTFAIIENGHVDGASDTDGIELVTGYINDDYPNGIFIAQDWYNIDDQYQIKNQNFKLVSWADIVAALN